MSEVTTVIPEEVKSLQTQLAGIEKRIAEYEQALGKEVALKTRVLGALEFAQKLYQKEISKKEEGAGKDKLTTS